ncbi:MAG: 4-hydroxybenzoate octaprenyltransferase [Armatimonadetes bacterium]|nr:4-hydroxybenzoate octaprenyltransferase [Armatimonadota bacterium]
MATAAAGPKALKTYLEMIKFEHSVFALPFAMVGMLWASIDDGGTGWPGWRIFGLIVLAMVTARSAAMAFNRIADRDIDADNPRTRVRAIPSGLLSLKQVNVFFYASCIIFFAAAASLNTLTLALSPVALFTILFYSRTKRFTPYCHFVLGLSLAITPAAAWAATTGRLGIELIPLTLAVALWTAGFDIIYSLQDEAFDREHGLRSLPETFGKAKALRVSRICHACAIVLLGLSVAANYAGLLAWIAVIFAAVLLVYEQSLVKPDDLSRVNMAFFTLNGYVSIGFFLFVLVDAVLGQPNGIF